jgi:acyl carrier protein
MATEAEVRRILGLILGRMIGEQENPSRSTEPNWDSLKHLELVLLLEDHFQVHFTEDDLTRMSDLDQLISVIGERVAA